MDRTINTYRNKAPKVAELLTQDIRQGVYARGTMLPPDSSLAQTYSVSRITMRRAISLLSMSGQVVKLPNKGVLVQAGDGQENHQPLPIETKTQKKIIVATAWSAVPDFNLVQSQEAFEKYVAEHQLEMRSYTSAVSHDVTLNFLNHIEDYGVDGVIVLPYHLPEYIAALTKLVERRFPVVALRTLPGVPMNTVTANRGVGAYKATHYLIDTYKRPVYYMCEPLATETELSQRLGYQSAMCEAGFENLISSYTLRYEQGVETAGFWDIQKKSYTGYTIAKKLFEKIDGPVSIAGLNDYYALGVYEAADEYHLTIGKDVCVVGFDDLPMAKLLKPSLSTIQTRKLDIGYEAMRLLQKVIVKYPERPISVEVPCDLIVRDST
jgi:DNA-binding LacI/PurR family transcriptional regulator